MQELAEAMTGDPNRPAEPMSGIDGSSHPPGSRRRINPLWVLLLLGAGAVVLFLAFRAGSDRGSTREAEIGKLHIAAALDGSGCPAVIATRLDGKQPIFVSTERSFVPRGTQLAARLYRAGQLVDETSTLTIDRDLEECVWFAFSPGRSENGLERGSYKAELVLNGSAVGEAEFEIGGP